MSAAEQSIYDEVIRQLEASELLPERKNELIENAKIYQRVELATATTDELILLFERLNCESKSFEKD
ncbi:MAG: hypothetical protein QM504_17875 [Pseudomonadota bacterium]